jgi:uncharacterized protein (TIGR03435 family)
MNLAALHPILEALNWALLDFLWQGAVLALLLLLFQTLARKASASMRYAAACTAMLLMLACFASTAVLKFVPAPAPVIHNPLTAAVPLTPLKQTSPAVGIAFLPAKAPVSAPPEWIAFLWLLGVASVSSYTLLGWKRVRCLRREAVQPIESEFLATLQRRLGISRAVRLYASALAEVPAVIGWMKPCILFPVTALTGLTESQLRAILAHELAHIRRHDYLINILQTAVETVLFYHPAVWWAGRRIRQERENCCDDTAIALLGDPVEYASALTGMEEIRARLPGMALAANGGDLISRIRRVLREPEQTSRPLGRSAGVALALLIAGVPALLSQEAKPAFAVASVKPDTSGKVDHYFRMGGVSVSMTNQTLKNMMLWAWRIHDFQLIGGPGWIEKDRYDVAAKAPADANLQQRQLMVQSLLEDRFRLALHREIKELPIYNLTLAKSGLRIQPIKNGSCIEPDPKNPGFAPGKTLMDYCGSGGFGKGLMEGSSATMTELAESLSNVVVRTVVNKTGVEGRFRYQVEFAPEGTSTAENGGPPPPADAPSIFTAIQEQLGLKLDSARGPVEVLVIDRAEKPSAN